MKTRVRLAALALAFAAASPLAFAQTTPCPNPLVMDHGKAEPGKPLASPPATADTILNGKTIMIKYNTPSLHCRTVGKEIAPFGKVWRTGANPATSFVTAGDIMVGDLKVPAGSYTLYTLPAAAGTPWMLILNKQTGQWGTEYDASKDLGRVPLQAGTLASPQEVMSISFEQGSEGTTMLHIKWGTVDESVAIKPAM